MNAMFGHIFRQYDIRGIVGKDLGTDVAEAVGRAFGSHVRAETGLDSPSVAVGYDNRDSSPDLSAALVRGLRASGVNVTDLGTAPTPLVYWAEQMLGTDASVVITGSHNPPEWNGIKMTVRAASLYGDAITGLRDRIERNDLASGAGEYERVDVHAVPWHVESCVVGARRLRGAARYSGNAIAARTAMA